LSTYEQVAHDGAADDNYGISDRSYQPETLVDVFLDAALLLRVRGADTDFGDDPQHQQKHNAPDPDDRVTVANRVDVPVKGTHHFPQTGPGAADTDQVLYLGRDDQQGDGGSETRRHGTGYEVDDYAQATDAHGQLYNAGEEAQQGGVLWTVAVQRAVCHQRHDGCRSHGHVLAAAHECVYECSQKRTVKTVLRWQTRQPGIRHRLWYYRQPDGHARHYVAKPVLDRVTW